jgi:cbb3-type cytochrome oxidase subunit 3
MGVYTKPDAFTRETANSAQYEIISFDDDEETEPAWPGNNAGDAWQDTAATRSDDDTLQDNDTTQDDGDTLAGSDGEVPEAPQTKSSNNVSKQIEIDEKRRAHDEAETKRKTEWETKQAAKKAAFDKAFMELLELSDENVIGESVKRTEADLERLTRRNMKMCVADHIQSVCKNDPSFARFVCYPNKSLINCFKYINKKAEEYIRKELELLGQKAAGTIGEDVPDDLCYQWAEDYFRDLDADVDKNKDDEFVPKPSYSGNSGTEAKKKETTKQKEAKAPEPPSPEQKADDAQLCFFGGAA